MLRSNQWVKMVFPISQVANYVKITSPPVLTTGELEVAPNSLAVTDIS